jgi:hypothetical protein
MWTEVIQDGIASENDRRKRSLRSANSLGTLMGPNMFASKPVRKIRTPFSTDEEAWLLEFVDQNYSGSEKKDWGLITCEHSKQFPSRKLHSLVMKYTNLTELYPRSSRKQSVLLTNDEKLSIPYDQPSQEKHNVHSYPKTENVVTNIMEYLKVPIGSLELLAFTHDGSIYSPESSRTENTKDPEAFHSKLEGQSNATGPIQAWNQANTVALEPTSEFPLPWKTSHQTPTRASEGQKRTAGETISPIKQPLKKLEDPDPLGILPTKCKKNDPTNHLELKRGDGLGSLNVDLDSGCLFDGLCSKDSNMFDGGHSPILDPRQHNVNQEGKPHFSESQKEWLFNYVFEKWDLSKPENIAAIDWRQVCLKFEEFFGLYPSVEYLLGSVIQTASNKDLVDYDAKTRSITVTKSTSSIVKAVKDSEPDHDLPAVKIDGVKNITPRRKSLRLLQVPSNVMHKNLFGDDITGILGQEEAIIPAMISDTQIEKDQNKWGLLRSNNDILKAYAYNGPPFDFNYNEHQLFHNLYRQFPKEWERIASGMGRDPKACIRHYYMTKKMVDYKSHAKGLAGSFRKVRRHGSGARRPVKYW